ncbi:MAG: phospho-N-acetylmuramoyl-pentapeptide-transferase [Patescibacteria group bacterium]|nr:phospho-N-acetylmuramoyl-pentapeptide-transferase [Patescibacteria group bacterium]
MTETFVLNLHSLFKSGWFLVGGFVLAIVLTPLISYLLYKFKFWKQIRQDTATGEKSTIVAKLHAKKRNTPVGAGVLIWGSVLIISLVFNFTRSQTYLPLAVLAGVGLLGLFDDWANVRGIGRIKGIRARDKLIWLTIIAAIGALWFYFKLDYNTLHIPRYGDVVLGVWYIPLFIFVVVAMANAVNITDGLDGLAAGLSTFTFLAYALICLIIGAFSLSYFSATMAGALLAFLWFNIYPARFFMGDTGSLAIGATLGVMAMLTNTVIILPIIALVFLVEITSSFIQIMSKKFFHRKIFLAAPLHHTFEARGWPEVKVTMRFWVIGAVSAVLGLLLALISRG